MSLLRAVGNGKYGDAGITKNHFPPHSISPELVVHDFSLNKAARLAMLPDQCWKEARYDPVCWTPLRQS